MSTNDIGSQMPQLASVLRAVPGVSALFPVRQLGAELEMTEEAQGLCVRACLGVTSAPGQPGAAQVLRAAHAALCAHCAVAGVQVHQIHLTVVHVRERC